MTFSTPDVLIACLLSVIIWILLATYMKQLGIVALDHSSIYSFMIAIDFLQCYKQPTFRFGIESPTTSGRAAFNLCLIAALVTVAAALLGLWMDLMAEAHLRTVIASDEQATVRAGTPLPQGRAARMSRRLSDAVHRLRSMARLHSWYAWRNLHGGMLMLLTTAHLYGLLAIVEFRN